MHLARQGLFVAAVAASFVSGTPGTAHADPEREAQRYQQELEELAEAVTPVAPDAGLERAQVQAPQWCNPKIEGSWSVGALRRTLGQLGPEATFVQAAMITCLHAQQPAVQKAAAFIHQKWINVTGLSAAGAIESLRARIDTEKFQADQKALCDQLTVSEEIAGEEKSFMEARRRLFGCGDEPMWMDASRQNLPEDLLTFLDQSSSGPDALVRLAVVTSKSAFALNPPDEGFDKLLLIHQVFHQIDFKSLEPAKVEQMSETEPYAGNSFAKVVIQESLARARLGVAAVEAAVKKKSSDAAWKQLLITAPQQGIAAYEKDAARYTEALKRSNAFERDFFGPSRKAVKGCWEPLRKDFIAVMKPLEHDTANELESSLAQPIPSLLFSRLGACAAIDQGMNYSNQLRARADNNRSSRGPRVAAFFAASDALTEILEDRAKFPISRDDFKFFADKTLDDVASRIENKDRDILGYLLDGHGVVKSVKKAPQGLTVTFATEKQRVMSQSCTTTNRILMWHRDGTPIYERNCKDTGMVTVDVTADPVIVPASMSDKIATGAFVEFKATRGKVPERLAMPLVVYSDKSKKKIVNFYGFGL